MLHSRSTLLWQYVCWAIALSGRLARSQPAGTNSTTPQGQVINTPPPTGDDFIFKAMANFLQSTPEYDDFVKIVNSRSPDIGSQMGTVFDLLASTTAGLNSTYNVVPYYNEGSEGWQGCLNLCYDIGFDIGGTDATTYQVAIRALTANVSRSGWNNENFSYPFHSPVGYSVYSLATTGEYNYPVDNPEYESTLSYQGLALLVSDFTTCLEDTCEASPLGSKCANTCSNATLQINETTLSFAGLNNCLQQVCTVDISFADLDLAGVGVTISYILQVCLALIGVACLHYLHIRPMPKGLTTKQKEKREETEAEYITSFVEFHKAQCFFVLAVQVAALTLLYEPKQSLENLAVVPITAAIGVQAPVFAYIVIARFGRHSTYMVLLTVSTWVLASVVMWKAYSIFITTPFTRNIVPDVVSCNGGLNALCSLLNNAESTTSYHIHQSLLWWFDFWITIWAITVLLLFGVLAKWFDATTFPKVNRALEFANLERVNAHQARPGDGFLRRLPASLHDGATINMYVFYIITLILAGCLGVELYQLGYIWELNLDNSSSWTFGQIVAVLVWAPVFAEFLNVSINGIVDGANFRHAPYFTLVRVFHGLPSTEMQSYQKLHADHDHDSHHTPEQVDGSHYQVGTGADRTASQHRLSDVSAE